MKNTPRQLLRLIADQSEPWQIGKSSEDWPTIIQLMKCGFLEGPTVANEVGVPIEMMVLGLSGYGYHELARLESIETSSGLILTHRGAFYKWILGMVTAIFVGWAIYWLTNK